MIFKKLIVRASLLGCALSMGVAATAFAFTKGTLNDDRVNVREDSNTSSNVLGKLNTGDEVEILGKEGIWYSVACDISDNAYIHGDYIDIDSVDAYIIKDNMKLREEPDDSSDIIAKLNDGDKVTVHSKTGNWYLAEYDGIEGYVFADYVEGEFLEDIKDEDEDLEDKYAVIIAETGLNLREEPSLDGKVVDILKLGSTADVIKRDGEWVLVVAPDGTQGYVNAEFVSVLSGKKDDVTGLGKDIIEFAEQYIGTPYVWAGTSLSDGVDCSGFVYSVFGNFGITLNRSSASMEAADGYYIDKNELEAGDLVFFDNDGNGTIDHVGIYMHDGYYIHSSSGKTEGVIVSSLYDSYSAKTYNCAKRVL